jgi:adenylate kinase
MFNLVIFGSPGAGKGTQSDKIIEKYHLQHLSTGDMFRAHIAQNTKLGQEVVSIMNSGQLVPDDITIKMLEEEILKHKDAKGFILDGFPRTIPQAKALDAFFEEKGEKVNLVIQLDVSEDEVKHRINERAKTSGRADDAQDKLIKRIDEYFQKTIHVLPYYKDHNKLEVINGIGEIDAIFENISKVIDNHFK